MGGGAAVQFRAVACGRLAPRVPRRSSRGSTASGARHGARLGRAPRALARRMHITPKKLAAAEQLSAEASCSGSATGEIQRLLDAAEWRRLDASVAAALMRAPLQWTLLRHARPWARGAGGCRCGVGGRRRRSGAVAHAAAEEEERRASIRGDAARPRRWPRATGKREAMRWVGAAQRHPPDVAVDAGRGPDFESGRDGGWRSFQRRAPAARTRARIAHPDCTPDSPADVA